MYYDPMKTLLLILSVALCLTAVPTWAADIRLNADQWNALSPEEQQHIEMGLKQSGALRQEDKIVADAEIPAFTEETKMALKWNPLEDFCKAGCDGVASLGVVWCTANTAGVGLAVCIAAAETVRRGCHDACE